MDAGRQLVDLIEARVAKGENRHAAEHAVFAAHPDLVRAWHHGGQEAAESERQAGAPTVDPGAALLALTNSYIALGMERTAAQHRAMREHPQVAAAYHLGITIPKARPVTGAMRRLASGDERLRPGETMVHKLADPSAGGGFFAMAA